jgi:putative ABC transport system permease protein
MLRNYLAVALGNLARNWPYAAITVLGLAISFSAAMLIGLFVRDELSYDRWIPGHDRVFRLESTLVFAGQKPQRFDRTNLHVAGWLRLAFPEVEATGRIMRTTSPVRRAAFQAWEPVLWADPGLLRILPMPAVAGDPASALGRPDAVVITRAVARRYFGRDDPIGQVLLISPAPGGFPGATPEERRALDDPHPMRVAAVIEDLPSDTHLDGGIFASGRAAFSPLEIYGAKPFSPFVIDAYTYLRLRPGASAEALRARLAGFAERHDFGQRGPGRVDLRLTPLSAIHLQPPAPDDLKPPGDAVADAAVALIGVLIVMVAAINFVTLMTARAVRRAVEVGVRKALGASRRDLLVQFLGEAMLHVALAVLLALAITELALPRVDAWLGRTIVFDYWRDPGLALAVAGIAAAVGLAAGLYPALVLSRFRPAAVLRGGPLQGSGAPAVRQALVVLQFAVLISLMISAGVIWRQTVFATGEALHADVDKVMWMTPCIPAMERAVVRLPGVASTSCASASAMGTGDVQGGVDLPGRPPQMVPVSPIDVGFFELYGIRPVAGRFFSRDRGEDVVRLAPGASPEAQPTVVLNQTAARLFGFRTPEQAVGRTILWRRPDPALGGLAPPRPSRIVGVAPDFTLGSVRKAIPPTVYYVDPPLLEIMVVRLDGRDVPATRAAIAALWRRLGDGPLDGGFQSQVIQGFYRDARVQGAAVAACAGLTLLVACLGLFALAAFTADRRTKEIGVRKALGAGAADVVALLAWQFTVPVLLASLIAWPVAWWVMGRWLSGFVYHVPLEPWMFLAATAAAVLIAWATVGGQALLVARSQPVKALRYE